MPCVNVSMLSRACRVFASISVHSRINWYQSIIYIQESYEHLHYAPVNHDWNWSDRYPLITDEFFHFHSCPPRLLQILETVQNVHFLKVIKYKLVLYSRTIIHHSRECNHICSRTHDQITVLAVQLVAIVYTPCESADNNYCLLE
jgi:hypothetical protein